MDKDIWKRLCEDFNYRFFAGVPFAEVASLYASMNSEIMHYIPAANEEVALRLTTGVAVSGFNSGIILRPDKISKLDFEFNVVYKIPVMIITTESFKGFYNNENISKVVSNIEKNRLPAVLVLGKESL